MLRQGDPEVVRSFVDRTVYFALSKVFAVMLKGLLDTVRPELTVTSQDGKLIRTNM